LLVLKILIMTQALHRLELQQPGTMLFSDT
jgi:hypothetical protein